MNLDVLTIALTAGSVLAAAVWTVAQIRSTTDRLTDAIDRLDETLKVQSVKLDNMDSRVRIVENISALWSTKS